MVKYIPGELLIFDYAQNLKIVGTYHDLNQRDKGILEDLITKSDFVALESDENRVRNRVTPLGGLPSLIDLYYFSTLICYHVEHIGRVNREFSPETDPRGRGPMQNEFNFCYRVAKNKSKTIYLVDWPLAYLLQELSKLPLRTKLHNLWCTRRSKPLPKKIRAIMETQRETYMLDKIIESEGPIQELTRKGVLIVGITHALNFAESISILDE